MLFAAFNHIAALVNDNYYGQAEPVSHTFHKLRAIFLKNSFVKFTVMRKNTAIVLVIHQQK